MLSNPCTLTFEHSFCKECIDRMTKLKENLVTLTCPLCEKEQIIESGFCNLKPSRLLKQLLDRAKGYFFQSLSIYSKMDFLKSFRYTHLFNFGALLLNKVAILSNLLEIFHFATTWIFRLTKALYQMRVTLLASCSTTIPSSITASIVSFNLIPQNFQLVFFH